MNDWPPWRCTTCGEWQPVIVLAVEHCTPERAARLTRIAASPTSPGEELNRS